MPSALQPQGFRANFWPFRIKCPSALQPQGFAGKPCYRRLYSALRFRSRIFQLRILYSASERNTKVSKNRGGGYSERRGITWHPPRGSRRGGVPVHPQGDGRAAEAAAMAHIAQRHYSRHSASVAPGVLGLPVPLPKMHLFGSNPSTDMHEYPPLCTDSCTKRSSIYIAEYQSFPRIGLSLRTGLSPGSVFPPVLFRHSPHYPLLYPCQALLLHAPTHARPRFRGITIFRGTVVVYRASAGRLFRPSPGAFVCSLCAAERSISGREWSKDGG